MTIGEATDTQTVLRFLLEPGMYDRETAMWAAARLAGRSRKVLGAGLGEADIVHEMGDNDA